MGTICSTSKKIIDIERLSAGGGGGGGSGEKRREAKSDEKNGTATPAVAPTPAQANAPVAPAPAPAAGNSQNTASAPAHTSPQRPPTGVGHDAVGHNNLSDAAGANASESGETIRLLLLGAAESGKTTLLLQIKMLYKQNFTDWEYIHRRAFIYNSMTVSMRNLLQHAVNHGIQILPSNEKRAQLLLNSPCDSHRPLDDDQLDAIINLWKDPAILESYKERSRFNLNDCIQYFFDKIQFINDQSYRLTPADLIRAYVPTVGVQNIVFTANNRSFQLFDIGGQKVDRKKWAMMYDGLSAIFFCLAISEYDQTFDDDQLFTESESRLVDSLGLLQQIAEEPKFEETPIFVYLNEIDVLKEKLLRFPLQNYMPDYKGKTDEQAMEFLLSKVKKSCEKHRQDLVFFDYICAIDTDSMAKILDRNFTKLLKLLD